LGYLSKDDPFPHVIQEIDKTVKAIQENTYYNILLVDDSSVVRRQVTSLLQARNYKVSIAIDGDSAIKTINTQQPDLILLDLELPDMNGEEVLKYLKKNSATAEIPVFILTGTYNASTVGKLIKQGANEFFLKPFIPEELLLKIDFWIDSKRKARESECERQLLQEYKDTVDRSSIVSKADKRGIITFVNDKFCEISGYFPAELIGKSHNIVRHSDMPKSAFEEIWSTILEGRAWEGVVKNRRKDGSAYWVQTIINPIIDIDGQIVEFIGIRHDITALEELKERMNKDLQISTDNFETMQKRAHQYEDAMDHTMAVMRTTNANIITYVNKTFCDISGYSKKDVIGLEDSALRAKQHLQNRDCEAIKQKLAQKEIVKFSFANIGKTGNIFHTDTTIYPIVNNDGKVIEHLHLMCNISDLIALHAEIENTQREIIYKMGEIGETRSKETGNHVRRVAEYSKLLALLAGLDEKEAEIVAVASPMHDIGKVAIPDSVLLKPGKLDQDEWVVMRTHSVIGYEVLAGSERPLLKAAAIIAKEHHEKFDGSGYPLGLSGEDIHIYGRIIAIADVFDALGSDRAYKKAWELEKILRLFHEERGRHFDPRLVDLFLNNLNEFLEIRDRYLDHT
jgi:PAS domain S-box-containing protein